MGMHDDTEMALIPKSILIAAAEFVEDLASEWEWKRNSIPKNDLEMAHIDLIISKLRQYGTPSNAPAHSRRTETPNEKTNEVGVE